jgi:RNA polymerase sigma-70 factor (ECF subfamily)
MPTQMNDVVQYLRSAALRQDEARLTDGQLLGHFIERRDEAAVTALVRRHGPMVWGVCRRILPSHHDAQDAFQATFLVLVRKAGSVKQRELIGNWLYGVAQQTARKARAMLASRRTRERQVTAMPEPAVPEPDARLHEVLDLELSRLPDKYRVALVLCDLEGKTRRDVARQISLPEGTLAGRLMRGRALLAKRLLRHGLVMSSGALAAVLSQEAAACVPASVMTSTIKLTTIVAAGPAAATGLISANVVVLTEGMLKTMFLNKLKTTLAAVLVGIIGVGGALCMHQLAGADQGLANKQVAPNAQGQKNRARADKEQPAKTDLERLAGAWAAVSGEADGQQLPSEAVSSYRLVFDKDKVTVHVARDGKEGTFKLDPTATPKTMDLTLDGGTGLGIYSLEGDVLKICFTESGNARPTEFVTKEGSRQVLLTLRRSKVDDKEQQGKGDSPQVAVLKEQIRVLQAEVDMLKARHSPEGVAGVLAKIDVEKSTVSITLKGTKLTLHAIPLATNVKFYVNGKEAGIDDLKAGMPVLLGVAKDDQKSVVTVSAVKKEQK